MRRDKIHKIIIATEKIIKANDQDVFDKDYNDIPLAAYKIITGTHLNDLLMLAKDLLNFKEIFETKT